MLLSTWLVVLFAHCLFLPTYASYDNTQVYQRHLQIPHVGKVSDLGHSKTALVAETPSGKLVITGFTAENNVTVGSNNIFLARRAYLGSTLPWTFVVGAQDDTMYVDWYFTIETVAGFPSDSAYPNTFVSQVVGHSQGALIAGVYAGSTYFGSDYEVHNYPSETMCPYMINITDSGQTLWRWTATCSSTTHSILFMDDIMLYDSYFIVAGHIDQGLGPIQLSTHITIPTMNFGVIIMAFNRVDASALWYYNLTDAYYGGTQSIYYGGICSGPGNTIYFTAHFHGSSPSTFPVDLPAQETNAYNVIVQVDATTGRYIKTVAAVVAGLSGPYPNTVITFGRALMFQNGIISLLAAVSGSIRFCTGGSYSTCETTAKLISTCDPDSETCTYYDGLLLYYNLSSSSWSTFEHYTNVYWKYDLDYTRGDFIADTITNILYQILPFSVPFSQVSGCTSLHELYEDTTTGIRHDDLIVLARDLTTMECLAVASYGTPPGVRPTVPLNDAVFGVTVYPGSNMVYGYSRATISYAGDHLYEPGYPVFAICVCHKGFCNKWGKCICDPGYGGLRCNQVCPGYISSSSTACSGHGYCNQADVSCVCDVGYTGSACSTVECSGHGKTNSTGACLCMAGWNVTTNCATATK